MATKIPEDFYSPKYQDYIRKQYYTDMENYGVGYRNEVDRENGAEWVGIVECDRLTVKDVMKEIFKDNDIEQPKTIRNKIKLYLDNSDQWYRSKSVKFSMFGSPRDTSGYLKQKNTPK
ncbi:hypothetical protein [Streptococcus lutetiensis]|uniref:hypothetical protein n=2 Tax=Streptococcus lutetiensis TaxID=150055 RepID=UPI001BDAD813|nr:hypothetical protein [Streptococcus lutetiensis]MBT0890299.1 hypothetical protein [Streptococcus lutetiensis]MBT0892160.1 hypothetical protein [Streptococcus lutetiensis]MBT0903046.1 hypothetical protein [Streptococcus lutetiensis]MBT0915195.1 hypothetical protein [Streptococcus lutetiensis]MBT0916885.1 hypothetical protein [Streptococcus lutetiensis]